VTLAISPEPFALRAVVLSAAALGLAWMGDALLYVVLPLYALEFGVALPWVGVVLSLNRIVRIFGYGWIGTLTRRFGGRVVMAAAAFAAALSTISYAFCSGPATLLAPRCVWGLAYGALNVLSTVYAFGEGPGTGSRVGLGRGISTAGPALALSAGAFATVALGPRNVFIALGLASLFAVPIALCLPDLHDVASAHSPTPRSRWFPSPLNLLFFSIMLAVDGIFPMTMSLLFAQGLPVGAAIVAAGLTQAVMRVATVVGSVVSGPIVDRFRPRRVLILSVTGVVIGLLGVAVGHIYAATAVIVLARAALGTTGSVLVAEQTGGTKLDRMASYSTWVDCGLAAGPLVAGVLLTPLGSEGLYALLAAFLAIALASYLILTSRPASPRSA
jgi:MFS transporter, DHA1 family, inner membrane transport protein